MELFEVFGVVTHKYRTQTGDVKAGVVRFAEVSLYRKRQALSEGGGAEPGKAESGLSKKSNESSQRSGKAGLDSYEQYGEIKQSDSMGAFRFTGLEPGDYRIECSAFGRSSMPTDVNIKPGSLNQQANIDLDLGAVVSTHAYSDEGRQLLPALRGMVGKHLVLKVESSNNDRIKSIDWVQPLGAGLHAVSTNEAELMFARSGVASLDAVLIDKAPNIFGSFAEAQLQTHVSVSDPEVQMVGGRVGVTLGRTASEPTMDQALWITIRNRTKAISFGPYREWMNTVLGLRETEKFPRSIQKRIEDLGTHMHGVNAYLLLKAATEAFLLLECGVRIKGEAYNRQYIFDGNDEAARLGGDPARFGDFVSPNFVAGKLRQYMGDSPQLPYIARVVQTAFPEFGSECWPGDRVFTSKLNEPCLIELIWSYWMDEGMLAQTMNAISRRFQNVRGDGARDPLSNAELDPLRPMNNLVWGHIQDEINRTSVRRRAYEYSHQYGLVLFGKATGGMRPADNRSKFLEAFHNLLKEAADFHDRDLNTTLIADGYRLLNSLKEVHIILAQGLHNQAGDMPWATRSEMMLMQYMLARPEVREYLQSRIMVPYKEAWMPQVDTMKTLQGWSDVTVTHFRDLAVYGEQLLLSIRYGDWIDVDNEDSAKNWARYWRPEIQSYIHAYRAVTGVDVTSAEVVDATLPAVHLQRRLAAQQQRMRP